MNVLRVILESPVAQRLGWTLIHFIWQGAAVALVLGLLLAALRRRRSASARYVVSCGALLLLAALPVVTFLRLESVRPAAAAVVARSANPTRGSAVDAHAAPLTKNRAVAASPALPVVDHTPRVVVTPGPAVNAAQPALPPPTRFIASASHRLFELLRRALPWLVLGWCVGVLALSVWNLGGWIATRRLRSLFTEPAPREVADAAGRIARRMGLRRVVRLLQSALIDSPMVIGAIRPVILLPAALLSGLSPAQVESLLAHELAHLRRHDYLVNLVQCLIETLLFYHPAVWWVSRRIRVEREHCCDDRVIDLTRDRATYVHALAAVAESRGGNPAAFAVAANSGGALLPRIRRLVAPDADAERSPRWLAGAVALAIGVCAAGAVITRAADPAGKNPADKGAADPNRDKDFDLPKTWTLDLEIVDKLSGEAMPGLSLAVRADNRQFAFSTDDRGHAAVEYPDSAKYLAITVKPDGFVPTTLTWRNDNHKDPVPGNFKLELERGTTIGGIVRDEAGKPIKKAVVTLLVHRKNEGSDSRVSTAIWDYPVTTDEAGKWHCDIVPADVDDPWIRLSHPDYLSDEMYGMTPKPPMEKLRDMTGVMVMKKGVAVAGRVLGSDGKPIAGATVAQGRDRFGSNFPSVKTDAKGNFRFAQARPGAEMVLTVTAKGRAPDQKTFPLDRDVTDLEFKLEPGHVIRGRVVDAAGEPLAGVMIATDTWRSNRALMFRTSTAADGRFIWDEAPADEVLTDVLRQGYMDRRRVPLKASDQETTITLQRPLHVTGSVVDAETGQPVETFRLIEGSQIGTAPGIYWDRRGAAATSHDGGQFEFDVTYPQAGHAVRVEAEGYLPAESRVFKESEGAVNLELKLKKGNGLAGVIRGADGKPVAGADVVLCIPPGGLYVSNGQLQQRRDHTSVTSDDAGNYKLPPQTGAYSLVVLHERGYAQVTSEQLAKSTDVTLEAWGKVTGTLRVGAAPKGGAMMTVSRVEPNARPGGASSVSVYHDLQAMTDKDGRFTFTRVPAGPASVSLQVRLTDRTTGYSQTTPINVTAGQTTEVDIGGVGRPVVGRINVPADLAGKIDWGAGQASFSTKVPNPSFPPDWQTMEPAARQKWIAEFKRSPEGRAFEQHQAGRKHFTIKAAPDGTFRTDDVPAGTYQATVVLMGPSRNEFRMGGVPLATGTGEFTVPEMPNGRRDEPLDIGAIEVKPIPAAASPAAATPK